MAWFIVAFNTIVIVVIALLVSLLTPLPGQK